VKRVDAPKQEVKKRICLAYCQGMKQEEIADCFDMAQSSVSKVIREAESMGWLVSRRFFTGPLSEEERKNLIIYGPGESLKSELRQLATQRGWHLPTIHVHYGGDNVVDGKDWDQAVMRWSQNAARVLLSLLSDSKKIGISLGRTMRCLVDALSRISKEVDLNKHASSIHKAGKTIFPLRGPRLVMWREDDDGLFSDPHKLTASSIATDLNLLFNKISDFEYAMSWHLTVPELIGFSPRFPFEYRPKLKQSIEDFLDEERKFVEDFIESCSLTKANASVFGNAKHEGGVCETADTLILPIAQSGTTRSLMPFKKEFAGIPPDWLNKNTVGDIGTVLLAKDGISKRDESQLRRIRIRQPGIRLEHIEKCAKSARSSAATGVIGCAVGKRALPVLKCIELGLLNHLFLDHACVDDLLELLKKKSQKSASSETLHKAIDD
jgi:hypothetical protein